MLRYARADGGGTTGSIFGPVLHRHPRFRSVVSHFLDRGGNRMFVGELRQHFERNINSFRLEHLGRPAQKNPRQHTHSLAPSLAGVVPPGGGRWWEERGGESEEGGGGGGGWREVEEGGRRE